VQVHGTAKNRWLFISAPISANLWQIGFCFWPRAKARAKGQLELETTALSYGNFGTYGNFGN
jgi:hypothetical protein